MNNIPLLPPYCPFCHKAFFVAAPAGVNTKQCHCKRGKNVVKQWMKDQAAVMETMSDPLTALAEPEPSEEAPVDGEVKNEV